MDDYQEILNLIKLNKIIKKNEKTIFKKILETKKNLKNEFRMYLIKGLID